MLKNLLKNWRTSLVGILGGSAQILALPINTWRDYILPVVTVLIGIFAKDSNKTGI